MDPVSLTSIIAGSVAALSAIGGLATVVLNLVQSFKAERDLKAHLASASIRSLQDQFRTADALSPAELDALRARLDALVSEAQIGKPGKDLLLSALRQSAASGRTRYALKLYTAIATPHTPAPAP